MKSRATPLVLAVFCMVPRGASAADADLRAGAAAIPIDPPLGAPLAGYYSERGAEGVLDSIHAHALVLEAGGEKAALVSCDLLSLPRPTVEAARAAIEREAGIPGSRAMLAATHQHTGPVVLRESSVDEIVAGQRDIAARYTAELPALIARAVAEAASKLAPARASAGIGREENLSFNRRFWMKDGTVSWNPPKGDPGIIRPAGPIDPDVAVVRFAGADGPIAAAVNFAMHPDTTGGTRVSADYPGALARRLAEYEGDAMVTLFFNGACGNINHRAIDWPAGQTSPAEARRIGTVLAGAVLEAVPRLRPVATGPLLAAARMLRLPLPKVSAEDVEEAQRTMARSKDPATRFLDLVRAARNLDVAAREGKPLEVEVQAIALGDAVAWVSLPGEVFVELGISIKRASPFSVTSIVEIANGSIGYIPNRPAYAEGNYEVVSARCAEGSGEMVVEAALSILEELHAQAAAMRGKTREGGRSP